ncbi:DapH/DapD/GlmU-related protein [Paramicrobacterium fandaimingii]|uniref:DapH/DapD/GlmU-related protein n=1 Tax=Paramicrobacterium fandaimingii TaxID=2708079 RepID=UPI0014248B62|nr:DapH/DapD/GlmU-related protein [Microbacterium fandaimingii]
MELDDLLEALNSGRTITGDSPLHGVMHKTSQEALRITGELNGCYNDPARVRELLSRLIGAPVDDSVTVFPPFTSDFGKNIRLGKRVFIISGCRFQDQGGIAIGSNLWLGANVTVLPGVTIGEDAVVGAGSIVTKDVPARTIVVGSPARVIHSVDGERPSDS